jgi:hypothetical protein
MIAAKSSLSRPGYRWNEAKMPPLSSRGEGKYA